MTMQAPVSYPLPLGNSGKRAAIDVDAQILADVARFLPDSGIAIVGSLPCPRDGAVRLVVDGSGLPDECAQAWHLVSPIFIQETVGSQRLVRLESIKVIERLPVTPLAA